ncbi:MAG: pentapeptide repeat-containing protein [Campylobacterales bacterium]|nr:pentapeptide repeat-containing protein [Campylobacterales bacterium]
MNINLIQCPKWINDTQGLKSFFTQLSQCSGQKVSLIFENNVFEERIQNFKSFFEEYDCKFETISFEKVTFQQYVRFDNFQCQRLEFNNVNFEKGGGIKSRDKQNCLNIDTFVFRPFQLDSDFVIDLGNYANRDGFLETEEIGRIRSIKFENHKDGNGQIYFVGINKQTEEADFRNKILDKVSFQNCDLSNCFFLNAKVDKAEFRNCIFPEIKNHKYVNMLDEKWNRRILPFLIFMIIGLTLFFSNLLLFDSLLPTEESIIAILFYIMLFVAIPYVFIALFSLNAFFHPFEYLFGGIFKNTNVMALNKIKNFHYHFGCKDESLINDELIQFSYKSKKDQDYMREREKIQGSYFSLIELYKQLKENFAKNDFQTAGNFFYAQRYIEMISSTDKKSWIESWVLNTHYFVNGFGERFIRPLVLLIATVVLFAWIPSLIIPLYFQPDWLKTYFLRPFEINKDYVATSSTPLFLLKSYDENKSLPIVIDINQSKLVQVENKGKQGFYLDKKLDSNLSTNFYVPRLKNHWHTEFYYSLSHFNLPFLSENKQWFQEVSQRAVFWGWVERSLLWLFSGAFVLALLHRIKR